MLLIGAVIWAYLGIIFEILTETVAWERWEGTIEYTFMAPLSRPVHLIGMGLFAIAYGLVRATLIFGGGRGDVRAAHAGRELRHGADPARDRLGLVHRDRDDDRRPAADLARRRARSSDSWRRGSCWSSPASTTRSPCCRSWMQVISTISPATYALRGIRAAILEGATPADVWGDIWPLLLIGVVAIPLGLWVFRRGEQYAKRHGKLKRSG